jgi:hypothetical protein
MKSKLPVIDIKGVQYQYDVEGKRLVPLNNPKQGIALARLKNDPKFKDFFEPIDGIADKNQRSIHVIVQKHALLGQKPSREEQNFLQALTKPAAILNQEAVKPERHSLKRKNKL